MYKTFITLALLLLGTLPAFCADTDDTVSVTASIEPDLMVTYTGDTCICFNVDKGGEITIYNNGDLNWNTNYPNWQIKVVRTLWTYEGDGDGWDPVADDMVLKLRADDPTHDDWREVGLEPMVWIIGECSGDGTMDGIDWRAFNTLPKIRPRGEYCVTVTFTIEPQN